MRIAQLKRFFEENQFNVFLIKDNNTQCAELEKRTDGGVDTIIWLNPFTAKEFIDYVKDFDIDDQIDLHRQDKTYKKVFTISMSLKDFTAFHNNLEEVSEKLTLQIRK